MTITLPNLDDRTFEDLANEAKGLIPQYAPSWTDHNPSDPGITLIELFAYLCEILIYRVNRVTDANKRVFLELMMGKEWLDGHSQLTMDQLVILTIKELRIEQRAITNDDYEKYALAVDGVARAYCRPLRNYETTIPKLDEPEEAKKAISHVSLVIVGKEMSFDIEVVKNLAQKVKDKLEQEDRLLLTTLLHVVPASFLALGVNLALTIFEDFKEENVKTSALKKLDDYFHPLTGGPNGTGLKLGEPVLIADIYALLDQLPGVDYIEPTTKSILTLDSLGNPPPKEQQLKAEGTDAMVGIRLNENELIQFKSDWSTLTVTRG